MYYYYSPLVLPFILAVLLQVGVQSIPNNNMHHYDILYSWKLPDFEFKSPAHREEAIKAGQFIPKNNAITGIKVSGNRVFLTVGRWRKGVPAALVYVPYDKAVGAQPDKAPKLIPYPSWEDNEEGNCAKIQYVQSMEIDQFNRMWVVDIGRKDIYAEHPDNTCPPKLLLIDLNTDSILRTFEFPADVVSRDKNFLNDIVVACRDMERCMGYISDAADGKLVAYDLAANRSWYVTHPSMLADPKALTITVHGINYTIDTTIDGIALSNKRSGFSTIYFCPVSSYDLFSVPAEAVNRVGRSGKAGCKLCDRDITHVGRKPSQTDGMAVDAIGRLFYGQLGANSIRYWNTGPGNKMTDWNQQVLAEHDFELQWPDTFAIDDGYLFATINRLQMFFAGTYDFDKENFSIVRFFINSKSYVY